MPQGVEFTEEITSKDASMMSSPKKKQASLSMVAGAIALRGVRAFLARGRVAAERRAAGASGAAGTSGAAHSTPGRGHTRPKPMTQNKLPNKTLDNLRRTTHFNKCELEGLYSMYRRLVTSAQAAASTAPSRQQPPKTEGIDQSIFRDVMHNTFDLVTEESILERLWTSWERGPSGNEGALKFDSWTRGLSVLLRGTKAERLRYCFNVYDLNSDGFITRDEIFLLLKNSLLKQPGDEDPEEGVRDLVELVLRKLDTDKDGRVSLDDYRQAVDQEPLLLEAFGQCLPTRRHAAAFLKTLNNSNKR